MAKFDAIYQGLLKSEYQNKYQKAQRKGQKPTGGSKEKE
tara:strand:+ start:300 stop:416 length:117 start_codon:yes stop_codon:yes gene_type:complete